MLDLLLFLYFACVVLTGIHLLYSEANLESKTPLKEMLGCLILAPIYVYGVVRFRGGNDE